jgi:hypothetical protein
MSVVLRLALLLLAPWMAGQAGASDNLMWRCWYDGQMHVTCVIDQLPATSQTVPGSASLPPVVRTLRNAPEQFRQPFLHIPLHNYPTDVEAVGMLARAVACGSRRDCEASFSARPPARAEMEAIIRRALTLMASASANPAH